MSLFMVRVSWIGGLIINVFSLSLLPFILFIIKRIIWTRPDKFKDFVLKALTHF